jgi:hypothetical protein
VVVVASVLGVAAEERGEVAGYVDGRISPPKNPTVLAKPKR